MRSSAELSFLDTISCALGGVIVLFFIFAALQDEGERDALSDPVELPSTKRTLSATVGADINLAPEFYEIAGIEEQCELVSLSNNNVAFKKGGAWQLMMWQKEKTSIREETSILVEECWAQSGFDVQLLQEAASVAAASCPGGEGDKEIRVSIGNAGRLALACKESSS